MNTRRVFRSVAFGALGASCFAVAGSAQDMVMASERSGIPLPPGYYARIAENPDFFEFTNVWRGTGPAGVDGAPAAVQGTFPLLVIPALFADSDEPIVSEEDLQRVLFDGPAPDGTLVEFYEAASRGVFTVDGVVADWVRTSLTVAEVVGTEFGIGNDARTGDFLAEAVALADETIDFGRFDSDGPDGIPNSGDDDGQVDALTFEFQEVTASCGGPGIWPHRSSIAFWLGDPVETTDPSANGGFIVVTDYLIQGATDCSGENIQTAGVISHEFGHALGLPDIYHPIDGIQPSERRWVLGCWALMAAGSWGCNDGSTRGLNFGPTSFSPWSKNELGWQEWIDVEGVFDEEYVLEPATESGTALRVPLDGSGREFFHIEYRPQTGFDHYLPSQGVLVYHHDTSGRRRPNRGSGTPYMVSLEEADGRMDLRLTHDNGGNRGEGSDAWGIDGPQGPVDASSVPNSRRNLSDLPSTVVIHSIVADGETARVRITNRASPGLLDVGALPDGTLFNPYYGELEMAGGAPPYTATVFGATNGMTVRTEGRRLIVEGYPGSMGTVDVVAEVEDFYGSSGLLAFSLEVGEFVMTAVRALTAFISNGQVPLSAGEEARLDELGNANGAYDIGDLRAFYYGGS